MQHIYIYADGSDLEDIEVALLARIREFTDHWGVESVRLINDRHPRTSALAPEDLPDWNLGLNFEAAHLCREKIQSLVQFLAKVSVETNREFVIGAYYPETNITEDMCFVGSDVEPELVSFLAGELR